MDGRDYASARDAAFWRAALSDAPSRVALSTDVAGDGPAVSGAVVPLARAAVFAGVGREQGATLFVTVLAAFAVLLYRYTGQTDLVIDGVPAGDGPPALPYRIRLDPAAPFGDTVRRTLATVNEAAAHPGVPRTLFPAANVAFGADAPAAAELHAAYAETAAGLELTLRSPAGRFEPAALDRLAVNLAAVISALAERPGSAASQVSLPSPAERQRLLGEWNPEPRRSMAASTLSERFAQQAAARPDALAVLDGAVAWTYAQLDARADALAALLLAHGIEHEELVAVDAGRSAAAILAMLAILKAGAAYLPLDADMPPDRLRSILAAARVRLVLGRGPAPARASGIMRLDLDALDLRTAAPRAPSPPHPDDLAYVMFTSGSTGRAKGVMIEQRGIVNLVTCSPALAIEPGDVVAQMASIAFDGATYEIWGALLNGATLAIVGRETMLDAAALAAFLRSARVSVAFLTPALLRHVVREEPSAFASLRLLIAGGEVLDPGVVAALFAHGPPGRLLNGYGPSETTTFATAHTVRSAEAGSIPIGLPLANVQTYVLDGDRNPVPIGARGELHIGGLGVARGYLGDPELTARRFIAHPFSADPAARLYATGDIVRQRSDGTIEFFGRADRQIKLRGFRIEIDDIEAALNAQPAVDGAVVVFESDDAGDGRLTAFVADTEEPPRSAAAWRAALGGVLPDHMLPARYVTVAAIPLNANGKTDFAALARFAPASPPDQPPPDAPDDAHTARERGVMRIFTDVLGVAPAGPRDDFFVLGGNSLLAARAIARIRERFGVELRLHQFFAAPTPFALAEHIASAPPRTVRPIRIAVQPDVAALSDAEIDALLDALRE